MAEERFDVDTALKADLQEKADALGLDTSGTVPELRARIREHEEATGTSAESQASGFGGNAVDDQENVERTVREAQEAAVESEKEAEARAQEEANTDRPLGGTRTTGPRGAAEDVNPLGFDTAPSHEPLDG